MSRGAGPRPGPAADLRLVPAAAATWAVALVALAVPPSWALALAGVCACAALVVLVRLPGRSAFALGAVAALACAAAASGAAGLRTHALHANPLRGWAEEHAIARVEMVVTGDPRPRKALSRGWGRPLDQVVLRARLEGIGARGREVRTRVPVVVLAPAAGWTDLLPSQRVAARVVLAPVGPHDDVAAVLEARGPPSEVGPPSLVQRLAGVLRAGLRRSVDPLPADSRGLVPGLVVGDTTRMPADLEADMRVAGLTHLTAVSGANVAIVLAAVLLVARWAGLRGLALPAVGTVGLLGFLVLARPDPSVLRATVMGMVTVLALVRGGRRAGVPSLALATVLLVLFDPFLARSAGFALSVLATAGLLVLAPGWRAGLARILPARVADAVAVPAAAQVAVAPVLVLLTPAVSLVAVPANLLVAPAVPPATVLGVVAAVTSPVSAPVAEVAARLAGVPAGWITLVGRVAAAAPGAQVGWPGGLGGAALLLVVLFVVLLVAPAAVRVLRRRGTALTAVSSLLVGGVAWVSPLGPAAAAWPPPGWVAVACDVGQGDALVLAAGEGAAVVVDTGPEPAAVERCLTDLEITTVPLVVLTHDHADHVEGLPGVLRGRSVGAVEVSPLDEPAEEAARVAGWTGAAGLPVSVARPGEVRSVGRLRWQVLWPARVIRDGSVPNNASIVLRVEVSGVVLLLTGDVELAAQRALLAQADLLHADVLKVPHHGSRLQDPRFLAAVGARAALVSVGAGNPYGHPDADALDGLRAAGAVVLRTDEHGDVAVVPGPTVRLVPRR